MRYPFRLVPQGVIPRDPNLTFRAQRAAPDVPVTEGDSMLPFMGVSVWSSVKQDALASAGVIFTFDNEFYDTDGLHDNATNPSRLVVPAGGAGKWQGWFRTGVLATGGDDEIQMNWRVNGTTDTGLVRDLVLTQNVIKVVEIVFPPTELADGDYLELIGSNNVDITFGSDFVGPQPTSYAPDYYDTAWAVMWRVGR